jgi:hypothetical protein
MKILLYVLIAILLGSVTMVVPYVILGSSCGALTDGDELIQPLTTEPTPETEQLDSGGRDYSDGEDMENPPSSTTDNSPVEEPKSEASGTTLDKIDKMLKSFSNFFPVVLMIIPSFLIAFSAIIYLKKCRF